MRNLYKLIIKRGKFMKNIPSSFMGYNRQSVNKIIKDKDDKLNTQQKDIDYLRGEITKLEKQISNQKNTQETQSEK